MWLRAPFELGGKLPHNRTRRAVRHSRAALVKLNLCHREEGELSFSLSLRLRRGQRRIELISLSDQPRPLRVERGAVHLLRLVRRGTSKRGHLHRRRAPGHAQREDGAEASEGHHPQLWCSITGQPRHREGRREVTDVVPFGTRQSAPGDDHFRDVQMLAGHAAHNSALH